MVNSCHHPGTPMASSPFASLSWTTCEVLSWGGLMLCQLPQKSLYTSSEPSAALQATTIESPVQDKQVKIPRGYQAFQDIFSKKLASKLTSTSAMKLLPITGCTIANRKIYSLPILEYKVCGRGSLSGLQSPFHIPWRFELLLCGKGRCRLVALHQLMYSQPANYHIPLYSSQQP